MSKWDWVLGLFALRATAKTAAREAQEAEDARHEALHVARCELAALLKDEPEEAWRRHGLDKAKTLARCGLDQPECGIEFYSAIRRKGSRGRT